MGFWREGINHFPESPFGYGAFTSREMIRDWIGRRMAPHNIYVQILIELGIQGLIALFILIFFTWRILMRCYAAAREPEQAALALGLAGYWMALCVSHFFVNPFFLIQVNGHFWLMTACVLGHVLPEAQSATTAAGGAGGQELTRLAGRPSPPPASAG